MSSCLMFIKLQQHPQKEIPTFPQTHTDKNMHVHKVSSYRTWGQFSSGIGIDGQFQLQNWNYYFFNPEIFLP